MEGEYMDLQNIYIGFDRDGTLEMEGVIVPYRLKEQFHSLQARGATLFIASGKSYIQLQNICQNLSLTPWLFCAENGAHILIPEQNIERFEGGDSADFQRFLKMVDTLPFPAHRTVLKKLIWSKAFDENVFTVIDMLQKLIKEQKLNVSLFSYPTCGGNIEVLPAEINKTTLLQHIPDKAVIHYIGDSENDLHLMQNNRVIPHAVGNASDIIKKCVEEKNGTISKDYAGIGVGVLPI